jgi:hypothetical protein
MPRDDNTRFRVTAWPEIGLPTPWGPRRTSYKIEGATILANEDDLGEPTTDHHEVYLDLLTVDLDDDDAILAFVNRHGPLKILYERSPGQKPPFNGFTDHPHFRTTIQADLEAERSKALHDWLEADRGPANWIITEPLAEFRWEAGCLRDLVAAWRFVHEGQKPQQLWSWVWGGPPPENPYSDPLTREGAAHLLARGLDVGLAVFHPHVQVGDEEMPYHEAVGFYEICCLELFTHVAEAARYKTCANQTCGRLFVRQEGRALHAQHRTTGVKYCSSSCARAQAQRAYRRREAEKGSAA